jgi:hypothetical protein
MHLGLNSWFTFNPPYLNGAFSLETPSFFSHSRLHHFHQSSTLKGTWEYGHAAKAFTLLALTLAFSNIIVSL